MSPLPTPLGLTISPGIRDHSAASRPQRQCFHPLSGKELAPRGAVTCQQVAEPGFGHEAWFLSRAEEMGTA